MKISGTGKRKTDPGYGEGLVQLDLDDDVLMDEDALVEVMDLGVDCAQGYLFGEPRLARPAA